MDLQPQVLPVVLDYQSDAVTERCVESLRRAGFGPVLVIDSSTRRNRAPNYLVSSDYYIGCSQNTGYAGGMNLGIDFAERHNYRYALLLNNDLTVETSLLRDLCDLLATVNPERTECATFYGGVIRDLSGSVWFRGGIFDRRTGRISQLGDEATAVPRGSDYDGANTAKNVGWITGALCLVDVSRIGGMRFDEWFFLYREELEFQLRCGTQLDAQCYVTPATLAIHEVGRSTGSSKSLLGSAFMSRNYLLLTFRHAKWWLPIWLFRWIVDSVLRPLLKREARVALAAVRGAMCVRTSPKRVVDGYR